MSVAMMSKEYPFHHPLDGVAASAGGECAADHLEIVRRQALAVVMAAPGEEVSVFERLTSAPILVRFSAPGEWLAVSLQETPDALRRRLRDLLGDTAFVCDQSDGRAVLRLSGPNVRRILAKGVGCDLHPSAFAPGASANVLCGHIGVNLARTGDDAFELVVMRSLAESLFADLMLMGREFDLTAAFSP